MRMPPHKIRRKRGANLLKVKRLAKQLFGKKPPMTTTQIRDSIQAAAQAAARKIT